MDNDKDNLKALKHLRDQPRGTHVQERVAAIKNLLGDPEIFKTLQMLRWPQGVICPRCHSSNIVRHDPPPDSSDQRYYYVCLNCKGEGNPSNFDDFTGLPIGSLQGLRQWILCWYLIGFCSVNQIAKILGVSIHEVIQMAVLGSELTEVNVKRNALEVTERAKKAQEQNKEYRLGQEETARSESKSPLKPGYKSKK